jgi:hypothetical protein
MVRVIAPALGIATLAAVLLWLPAQPAVAQRIAPVTVTNTPLPTTITNTPAVTISGTPAVSVGNTIAAPLFVRSVDVASRQPFARDCVVNTFSTSGLGSCSFAAVPAGKRWVIEGLSGLVIVDAGLKPFSLNLQLCSAGYATDNFYPAAFQGNSAFYTGDYYTVNQPVRLYSDNTGGCTGAPFFSVGISNTSPSAFAEFILSGYLVDVP